MFYLGALAEFERELIIERTQEGITRAKIFGTKSGKPIGQPKKQLPMDEVNRLLLDGVSKSAIARKYGVHRSTVYERLNEEIKKKNKMVMS